MNSSPLRVFTASLFLRSDAVTGLDWQETVKPLMEKCLNKLPIDVFIHLPWVNNNLPEHMIKRQLQSG
jgi:hypothetical protein